MISEITLEINGYKQNILGYSYRFTCDTDRKGRPTTGVLDGSIYVEMESTEDSSILDMTLSDMRKPWTCFFFHTEPTPVSGKIQHIKDDMIFRELVFDEAYIYYYDETIEAERGNPMTTRLLISPTRLDINRLLRLDRRLDTTDGFWWEEYKEEEKVTIYVKNEPEEKKEDSPECTISFRRCKDYDGSFGFDWLRVGDTSDIGCEWYRDTMYNARDYDHFVSSEYRSFDQQWKKQTETYKATARYIIPWVTLLEGNTATFRIKMEVNKPSGKLDVKIVGDEAKALSVNLKTIEAQKTGNYYYSSLLKVKCNSTFSELTAIEVHARGELVGKMFFVPNNKTHPLDIAIVTVKTKTPKGQVLSQKPNSIILEGMKRLLQQAYIVPHFKFYDLDLSQSAEYIYDKHNKQNIVEIEKFGGKKGLTKIKANLNNPQPLFNFLWRNSHGEITFNNDWGKARFDSIYNFLNKILVYNHKFDSQFLSKTHKIYFIDEGLFAGGAVSGIAHKKSDTACIASNGYTETTTTHELLHLLSLEHSFDESSKHIYYKSKTDNLMDYDENENNIDDRKSLWYWQIKQIWNNLK